MSPISPAAPRRTRSASRSRASSRAAWTSRSRATVAQPRAKTITAELKLPDRVSENEGCSNGTITLVTKRNGKLSSTTPSCGSRARAPSRRQLTTRGTLLASTRASAAIASSNRSAPRRGGSRNELAPDWSARARGGVASSPPRRPTPRWTPPGCTDDLQYDPSIPTYNSVLGTALGSGTTGSSARRLTLELQTYQRAVVNATQNNPRVRVIEKKMSDTALGEEVWYSVDLDAGEHRQPRRRAATTRRSGPACARATSRPTRASRRSATGPRSRGSRPPRTATSRPRARPRCGCCTRWPRGWTAPTRAGCRT